ncbi:MAG: chromosome segregation protein SMC [Clostridiales bacterium]|nr:chromosome segregation protein SMC [Clostridiales bacterium]
MLYLKKIEMYGFKSFADKIELKFDQPITGIVGPNGCGKSNISDAIRWVLGEQSTKNLRGKLMQDLIFNGTDTRKSMSYCEVSLFFDNTTRLFSIPMDEIIISRKLYRNNESEYLLNRNVVRLRDILSLLRGVGLGRDGYSIVGQGRMDAILNARPEDRRSIFEAALGISTFRVQKEETERKLEKTRTNMTQIMILVEEMKRHLPELKRQSTLAKKYIEVYDELRLCEINAYIYGYDNASQDKENGKKKLQGLKEEYNLKESQYADINEQYDEMFHRRNGIDGEITALRDRQVALAVRVEKNAGEKNLIQERINSCNRDIESNEELIATSKQEIENLKQSNEDLAALLVRRNEEMAALENEVSQANEHFASVGKRVDEINQRAESLRSKLDEAIHATSESNSKLVALQTEKSAISERYDQIVANEAELTQKLQESAGEEGDLLGRYDKLRKEKDNLENTLRQLKQQIKDLEFKQFNLAKELTRKQQAYSGEKGGIDMLRDFAANYRGYQASIQYLMQDAKRDKELASHIRGVVANLMKVEPKLQLAIETALGGRLQNIVTENEEDVKYLINYLKINDYGKATFLPVSSMKPHGIDRAEVLKEKGVLGVASELVSFDKHYSSVFESLLGGIVVVDTFDNAIAISRKYRYAHRMVTLTGERVSNDGSMEGGSAHKQSTSNLLSYETQIAERSLKLEELLKDLQQTEEEKRKLDTMLEETRTTSNGVSDALNTLKIEIATAKEKIETSNTLSNSDKKNVLRLSGEKERLLQRMVQIDDAIKKYESRIQELSTAEKQLRDKSEHARQTSQLENSAKDTLYQSLSDKRYRLAVLASNIETAEKDIKSNNAQMESLQDGIKTRLSYISQVRTAIDALYSTLNESVTDSNLQDDMAQLLTQIKETETLKVQMDSDFQRLTDERFRLSNELEALRGTIDKEEYILNKIDDDLLELQQKVQEEYGITYSAAMQYKDDNYDKEVGKQRISELKQEIMKMGHVNVAAIQELEVEQTRYDELLAQIDDLKKAEEDLKSALKELTTDIESRFEEGMAQINDNFKLIFRELFNGGNARLYIEKDPSKESLDQGVEIEAQPPGKKLQNISLLSGGERTMTTAAILFSILKYNPMPFCVLDEIEAALDDANAERIAKYLRKFSLSTQFIVITHKKPTMENADVLYGVTMEEKGVSKIVSVKLTEAIKQAM